MKKNRVMRAASAILVLAILTTCIFSGTMAKYIISDYTTDSARVAKFGVVVSASGDLFGPSYAKAGEAGANEKQVWTDKNHESVAAHDSAATLLVAPGTQNTKGMTFSVYGKPEVTTMTIVNAPEADVGAIDNKSYANCDVFLSAGAYSIMIPVEKSSVVLTADNATNYYNFTDGDSDECGTFTQLTYATVASANATLYRRIQLTGLAAANTMSADYYPIKWTVTKAENGGAATTVIDAQQGVALMGAGEGSVAKVIADTFTSANTVPNTTIDKKVNVTWAWDYGTAYALIDAGEALDNYENTSKEDLMDTVLGQMAALAVANSANPTVSNTYKVAKSLVEVKYAEVDVATNSANKAYVAYAGNTKPTLASDDTVVACLTASFGARITVTQVD